MKLNLPILLLIIAVGLSGVFSAGCRRIKPPVYKETAAKTKPAATQAASAPASKPAPKLREYKIRPGDTLRKIATRECGNQALEWRIKKYNPDIDERNLKVGQVILIPEKKVKTAENGKTTK